MNATATNLALERELRNAPPERLFLDFIAARAEIDTIDKRCREAGRDPTAAEDRDWSASEAAASAISDEFKRRLNAVLGGSFTVTDLFERGAL